MINLDDRIFKDGIVARLKPNAFTVLLAITMHLGKGETCFPSNERLEEMTGLGREAVQNAKKLLAAEKLIKYEQKKKDGKRFSHTEYTINTDYVSVFVPTKGVKPVTGEPSPEHPVTGEPITVEPSTGEPQSENPPLSINHSLSINSFSLEKDISKCFSETLKDYEGELNTQTQKNEQPGEVEVITPKKEAKPKKEKTTKPQKILFAQTEFCAEPDGYQRFEAAMIARNKKYENYNLDYYYQAVQIWSEKGNYAVNWIATAAGFILRDDGEGKGKMKIVPMNGKPQSPDPNSDYYKNAPTLGYARDQK